MEFDLKKPYCFYFNEICKIPHGSGNEKALSDWLVAFAKDHGLDWVQDEFLNVVIYKSASPGWEDHPTVVIQAHMDMVCEKVPESTHDFENEPLELYVEGDHLRARGTTLGADDGMGCAYMLAILADPALNHPALECCFTTGEETGLIGAQGLKKEFFKGRRLINLDGASEYRTYMSMGGGEQVTLTMPVQWETCDAPAYRLTISGLLGGHSGGMIDKERANAGKLMARLLRLLNEEGEGIRLAALRGGTKHNVIIPEAETVIATEMPEEKLTALVTRFRTAVREEYELSDPDIEVSLAPAEKAGKVLTASCGENLVKLLNLLPYGLQAKNLVLEGCPPITSVNVGVIALKEEEAVIGVSARSALESAVEDLKDRVILLGSLFGASAQCSGYYPGWKYEAQSPLREIMKKVFFELYHEPLKCLVGHGGNECGVFKKMFPEMDIVTSGAIYGNIHGPQEFLDLASFDRAWILLTRLIAAL